MLDVAAVTMDKPAVSYPAVVQPFTNQYLTISEASNYVKVIHLDKGSVSIIKNEIIVRMPWSSIESNKAIFITVSILEAEIYIGADRNFQALIRETARQPKLFA